METSRWELQEPLRGCWGKTRELVPELPPWTDQVRRKGKDVPSTGNSINQGTEAAWAVAKASERYMDRGLCGKRPDPVCEGKLAPSRR